MGDFFVSEGNIDEQACASVIRLAKPLPVTLHRAIDHSKDWQTALETAIGLGFSRVLSSGQATTAVEGMAVLSEMVAKATGRIGVIVGKERGTVKGLQSSSAVGSNQIRLQAPVCRRRRYPSC